LQPLLQNPLTWVCPTKRRGLTYHSEPGLVFDPSITGFLSYGFNELGVFGLDIYSVRKSTAIRRPTETPALTEVYGSDDPAQIGGVGSGDADAAWLDEWWALNSYPLSPSPDSVTNHRFQSQKRKHQQRVNVIYADGHAGLIRPSRLAWGQFFNQFEGAVNWRFLSAPTLLSTAPVSTPALDAW
jgi:prepilin-type processing-associated H-X9-DG protein